jgi:hypothetical protein
MTAFGVIVAATIKQEQTFTNVVQLMVIPLLFPGAMYPISGLPTWLGVLSRRLDHADCRGCEDPPGRVRPGTHCCLRCRGGPGFTRNT